VESRTASTKYAIPEKATTHVGKAIQAYGKYSRVQRWGRKYVTALLTSPEAAAASGARVYEQHFTTIVLYGQAEGLALATQPGHHSSRNSHLRVFLQPPRCAVFH
jgi:hypothetical protein